MTDEMIGHFEEKNEIMYLVLDDVAENKKVSKKHEKVWEGVKKKIKTFNGDEKTEYGKDFLKIRFKSNDDVPLNKPIKLRLLTIIMRCVISGDGKFHHQLLLDDALYEL